MGPMGLLCSFGDGLDRSWTDISTNHTFISGIAPELGVATVTSGKVPVFALSHFLHEVTHHTCLKSPVGSAMAVLDQWTLDQARSSDPAAQALAQSYQLRSSALLMMYRPLLEGLALFTEFDAMPGPSAVISMPMFFASRVFALEEAQARDLERTFDATIMLLVHHRASGEVVDRKASLLSSPFVSTDGYLAGYLLMKCFSTWAGMITPAFGDTDFTLSYAIHHFFDDYALAELLLAPSAPDHRDVAELVTYTASRLRSLFSQDDLLNRANPFEAQMLDDSGKPETFGSATVTFPPPALDNDIETVTRARRILGTAMGALSPSASANLARRSLLHLSSIPVTVKVRAARPDGTQNFQAWHGNQPLVAGPSRIALGNGDSVHGSIDIFFHAGLSALGITVSVRGEIIWQDVAASADKEETLNQWLTDLVIERKRVQDESAAAATEIDASLSADWASKRTAVLNSLLSFRDETYADLGLPWLPESRRPDFITSARRRGFRGAVDPALIRSLAVLSMLDSSKIFLEEASFSEGSGDLEADCEALCSTFENDFGGTPIALEPVRDEEQVRSRIHSWL